MDTTERRQGTIVLLLVIAGLSVCTVVAFARPPSDQRVPAVEDVTQAITNERLVARSTMIDERVSRIEKDLRDWRPGERLAVVESGVSRIESLLYGVIIASGGHLLFALLQMRKGKGGDAE